MEGGREGAREREREREKENNSIIMQKFQIVRVSNVNDKII